MIGMNITKLVRRRHREYFQGHQLLYHYWPLIPYIEAPFLSTPQESTEQGFGYFQLVVEIPSEFLHIIFWTYNFIYETCISALVSAAKNILASLRYFSVALVLRALE